ncbi:LKAM1 protein, partial [Polypterus senegalus]
MNPQEKARYLAYKEPSKEIRSAILCSQQRLQQWSKESKNTLKTTIPQRDEEYRKHENLIGQLKAAEARNRIRLMRLKYQSFRVEEVNHFISCQPTAQRALRLELLLPRKIDTSSPGDTLDTLEGGQRWWEEHENAIFDTLILIKLITARQQAMGLPVLPSQEEEDEEELANNEAIITYSDDE